MQIPIWFRMFPAIAWLFVLPYPLVAQNTPVVDSGARWCDAVVAFNEVSYHPTDPGELGEWIELHNLMAVPVDISEWSISGGVDYVFPSDTIIPGKSFIIVALDPAYMTTLGVSAPVLGPYSGKLSNGGEELELKEVNGRTMDWLEYGDRGLWPCAADGAGPTLSRIDETTAGNDPTLWGWSNAVGGSPGVSNVGKAVHAPGELRFVESSAAGAAGFFLEIQNLSNASRDLSAWEVRSPDHTSISLASLGMVQAGERKVVSSTLLGYTPVLDDLCSLVESVSGNFADTVRVGDRPQARQGSELTWRFPLSTTPGGANLFPAQPRVVINEILYQAAPHYAVAPVVNEEVVVPLGATWRYLQSGANVSSTFAAESFNDSAWPTGPGCFYSLVSGSAPKPMPVPPLGTILSAGKLVYYFRHTFTVTGNPADSEWRLRHLLDDGAIIYINGQEVFRWHLPTGTLAANTAADTAVGTANFDTHIQVPASYLKTGTNVLAVELRQTSTTGGNNDVFFGLDLLRETITAPGTPFADDPEEWIELHCPGNTAVDMSGWMLEGAVGYTFPAGTTLSAGGYLVVARDPVTLMAKYPALSVLGPWQGGLGNDNETIRLTDNYGNPAGSVHYFDREPWPKGAGGRGSSLELVDPRAGYDNPAAWAASDESTGAPWKQITYRGVAGVNDGPAIWQEFVCGLLADGEILLDDVSVIENPSGAARELIRNGNFEQGIAPWRARGTHKLSQVIEDPTQPGNHVLCLKASDSMEHEHNLVEITLADGVQIQTGVEYQISFRARWITGSPQFHTRLYFNRLARTHILPMAPTTGTPGFRNSRWLANAGPVASELSHSPTVPAAGTTVTVSTRWDDPDGVASATLWYRRDPSESWQQVSMNPGTDGSYRASVTAGTAGQLTQFYVEASDTAGAVGCAPAAGPESAALWQVNDGRAATNGAGTIRLIAPAETWSAMEVPSEVDSNYEVPVTLIIDESEVFYDCGMRFKSAMSSRSNMTTAGFNLSLPAGHYFRNALKTLSLDRKGADFGYFTPQVKGPAWQVREMLAKQIFNRAGGLSTAYDDLVKLITTGTQGAEYAQLMQARFSKNYLDNLYANGGDGALYKEELIYYPTRTTLDNPADADYNDSRKASKFPEAPKLPNPNAVYYVHVGDLGPDPERYRQIYLMENNGDRDDFSPAMAWARYFGQPGSGTWAETSALMDVDAWMRAYAATAVICTFDNLLGSNTPHNQMLFARPEDGKIVPLMWDNDFFFSYNNALLRTPSLNSKIMGHPEGERLFWGHLNDLVTRVVTPAFVDYWTAQYQSLLPNDTTWYMYNQFQKDRVTYCAARLPTKVEFTISTNNGQDFSVGTPYAVIEGRAWIDVRSLRLNGRATAPVVTWLDRDTWRATVPLTTGANLLVFEAVGYHGDLLATQSLTVTSTAIPQADPRSYLRISELYYNPLDNADAEFLELVNTGTDPAQLAGVSFTNGITFAFPANSPLVLAPGGRALLVRNSTVFASIFGSNLSIAGQYTGALDNAGERLRFVYQDEFGQSIAISDFTYDDSWYPETDGGGYSLVVRNELAPPADWNLSTQWRASWRRTGSPLQEDTEPPPSFSWWQENYFTPAESAQPLISGALADPDGDGLPNWLEYAFGFSPKTASADDQIPHWTASTTSGSGQFQISFRRPINPTDVSYYIESSVDMQDWEILPWIPATVVEGTDEHETVTIDLSIPASEMPRYLRLRVAQ